MDNGHLLGFIVSKEGIQIVPLKVQVILDLPPPSTLLQLQSLQGKENFLHRFIHNYADINKGFIQLLKNDVPFLCDVEAQ